MRGSMKALRSMQSAYLQLHDSLDDVLPLSLPLIHLQVRFANLISIEPTRAADQSPIGGLEPMTRLLV